MLPSAMSLTALFNPVIVAIDLIRAPIQAPNDLAVVLGAVGFPLGLLTWRFVLHRYRRYEGVVASLV